MTIQAIETRYRGFRFRSRLEARWAVCFEHLKIPWTYEPEGYELPSGYYLPDFQIKPSTGVDIVTLHAEVKGDLEHANWARLWEFASITPLVILGDIPEPMPGQPPALFPMFEAGDGHNDQGWICFGGPMQGTGGIYGINAESGGRPRSVGERLMAESKRVSAAFEAARSARFEHGEAP